MAGSNRSAGIVTSNPQASSNSGGWRSRSTRTQTRLWLAAGAAVILSLNASAHATVANWLQGTVGTWNTAADWNPSIPNAVGDTAQLDDGNAAASSTTTQNIAGGITLGTISHYGLTSPGAQGTTVDHSWIITDTQGITMNMDGAGPGMAVISNSLISAAGGVVTTAQFNSMVRVISSGTGTLNLADDLLVSNTSNSQRTIVLTGSTAGTGGSVQMQAKITGTGNIFVDNEGGDGTAVGGVKTTGNDPVLGPIGFSAQGAFIGNTTIEQGAVVYTRGDCFGPIFSNVITLGMAGKGAATLLDTSQGGFSMENSFVIAGGTTGTLLLGAVGNALGAPTASVALKASPGFTATMTLNGNLTLTSNIIGANTYEIGDAISGVGGITKIGVGNALFSATNNSYQGATTVNAGTLVMSNSLTTSASMTVDAGANTGLLQLSHSGTHDHVIKTGAVTVNTTTGTNRFDLADNKLITTTPVATVQAMIVSGQGAITSGQPAWNGKGIITSESTASTSTLTTLAVASAGDVKNISGTTTATWGGQTVHASDTLVMYTYGGDANLDGKINADDYFRIDSNANKSGTATGYFNGDFNYDGLINGDDYFIIDNNFLNQSLGVFPSSAPIGLAGVTAVPEPASLTGLALAGAALFARRRRRN